GLACAMGMPLDRVFASDERERFTILDAPRWAVDGRERLAFNTENKVGRAVLFPTFMLSGGTFLPHLAPAVCAGYNDWMIREYCAGSGGRLIPAAALPTIDVEASVAEVRRTAAMGVPVAFIRTNPVAGTKYSDCRFDPLWQAIVDTGIKLGLHPLPMWDQDGTSKGYRLPDIMAASCLGFPMDMIHTLHDMMSGGVFDRFPGMPTMILEAGAGRRAAPFARLPAPRVSFGRLEPPRRQAAPAGVFEGAGRVGIGGGGSRWSAWQPITSRSPPTGRTTMARPTCWPGSSRRPRRPASTRPTRRCSPPARSRSGFRHVERWPMTWGVAANAAATPDRTALVCGTRRLTYGELDRWVNRIAGALAARGLGPGGRVAVLLPNGPEFLAVTHAASKLGALAVPINWRWRRGEIAYVLEDAAPDVFVRDRTFLEEGAPARDAAGAPAPERCLVVGGAAGRLASFEDAVGAATDTPPASATLGGFN